jgi:hypothetical protein
VYIAVHPQIHFRGYTARVELNFFWASAECWREQEACFKLSIGPCVLVLWPETVKIDAPF